MVLFFSRNGPENIFKNQGKKWFINVVFTSLILSSVILIKNFPPFPSVLSSEIESSLHKKGVVARREREEPIKNTENYTTTS